MISNAKTFSLSDTEEPGDTLRGAHKDSRHWKLMKQRRSRAVPWDFDIAVLVMTRLLKPIL